MHINLYMFCKNKTKHRKENTMSFLNTTGVIEIFKGKKGMKEKTI